MPCIGFIKRTRVPGYAQTQGVRYPCSGRQIRTFKMRHDRGGRRLRRRVAKVELRSSARRSTRSTSSYLNRRRNPHHLMSHFFWQFVLSSRATGHGMVKYVYARPKLTMGSRSEPPESYGRRAVLLTVCIDTRVTKNGSHTPLTPTSGTVFLSFVFVRFENSKLSITFSSIFLFRCNHDKGHRDAAASRVQ